MLSYGYYVIIVLYVLLRNHIMVKMRTQLTPGARMKKTKLRFMAVGMSLEGVMAQAILTQIEVPRSTVGFWLKTFKAHGDVEDDKR